MYRQINVNDENSCMGIVRYSLLYIDSHSLIKNVDIVGAYSVASSICLCQPIAEYRDELSPS